MKRSGKHNLRNVIVSVGGTYIDHKTLISLYGMDKVKEYNVKISDIRKNVEEQFGITELAEQIGKLQDITIKYRNDEIECDKEYISKIRKELSKMNEDIHKLRKQSYDYYIPLMANLYMETFY